MLDRARLQELRAKCKDGSVSLAEYTEAIAAMREERYSARSEPKTKAKRRGSSKAKRAPDTEAAPRAEVGVYYCERCQLAYPGESSCPKHG